MTPDDAVASGEAPAVRVRQMEAGFLGSALLVAVVALGVLALFSGKASAVEIASACFKDLALLIAGALAGASRPR